MNRILIISLSLCINVLLSAQTPDFLKDSLDIYVNREMKRWNLPGLAVAVVKDGNIIVMKGYGYRDLEKKEVVNPQTLFQIASNSKAFTGTSLAWLAYENKLSLDDKAQKWLPYFSLKDEYASKEATVRDLLCHRIGFKTFQSDFLNWGCDLNRKDIIVKMKTVTPSYSFRSRYGYCNSAFLAAGEVIKAVCDTSWDDFLKYRFFAPLKMERSSTTWKALMEDDNRCSPYTISEGKLVKMAHVNVDNLGPAASINSCARDLSHWLICQLDTGKFMNKQIIPKPVIFATRYPQMITGDRKNPLFPSNHFNAYGLGWFLKDLYGKQVIEHTGGANGFVTSVCLIPESNLGIVVLTNSDVNELFIALKEQIIAAYFNQEYINYSSLYYEGAKADMQKQTDEIKTWRKKVAEKKSPTLKLNAYEGKYNNEVYGKLEITAATEWLNVKFENHKSITAKLYPLEGDEFFCEYSDPIWGLRKIKILTENNKAKSVIINVSEFVDYMPYEFKKSE